MHFHSFILSCWLAFTLTASASPLLQNRANGIDQSTYNDLERYTKYSSAAYQLVCPRPLGNKLVNQVRS